MELGNRKQEVTRTRVVKITRDVSYSSNIHTLASAGALKMTDMKMTDHLARHENAGHEIAGHDKNR